MAQPKRRWSKARTHSKRSTWKLEAPKFAKCSNCGEPVVPSNATSDISVIENYALQDKEGNEIYTKYDKNNEAKLYIKKDNNE